MQDDTTGKTGEGERLYQEREKRISDAIALRKPDRVPVWSGVPGLYPSERLGISREEQMMDIDRSLEANFQTALYYEPDIMEVMPPLGAVLAPLGYRHLRWAGHGLPPDSGWQFVDEECMRPEEYPFVLVEGRSTSRLEVMADVPPGKVCYWFDHVDMLRAKEVLVGKACIAGNVPISLLTVGTRNEVRAYCRNLIEMVGRDGGFILGPSGQTEDVKIENVKAMVDSVKE